MVPSSTRTVIPFPSVSLQVFHHRSLSVPSAAHVFEERVLDWTEETGLITDPAVRRQVKDYGIGVLGYLAYHRLSKSEDRLLLAQFLMWTTLIDDHFTETDSMTGAFAHESLSSLVRLLDLMDDHGDDASTPEIAQILSDVYGAPALFDIYRRGNRAQRLLLNEFKQSLRNWFESTLLAYTIKTLPNVEQYLELRVWDGATMLYCDALPALCSEFAVTGYEPRAFCPSGSHFLFTELKRLAAKHIASVNDVVAVKKEYERGDTNNLCIVLQMNGDLGIHDAIDRGVSLINNFWDAFLNVKALLPLPEAEPARSLLTLSINIIEDWMNGHLHWYYAQCNQRYSKPPSGVAPSFPPASTRSALSVTPPSVC